MMKRRLLSISLAVCMVLSLLPTTVFAAEGTYGDTAGHWAETAIERWSGYGVLQGSGGQFRPDDPITRAELAAVIDRVMKYQDKSDIEDFTDVDASAWYASSVLKLNAAGVMLGSGGKLRPNDNITREEAAVMIGRAFAVPENSGNENPFPDAGDISGWASFLVDGMKVAGYIGGYPDGSFGPKNTITRAEVVTILDNMVDPFYYEAGEYDNAGISFSPKNVVINADGVTLKNTTITGDLYITQGVSSGTVTLENVTVTGTTYIWGGGPNSVIATDCDLGVVHLNAATNPAFKLSTGTKAVQIYLDDTGTVTHGGVTVTYDAATDTVTFGGTIDKVTLNADGTATLSIGGIIYDVIPPEGTVSKFELAKDAIVKEMVVNAPVDVTGTGKIEKMEVHSDGVVIDKAVDVKPENITVDKDVKVDVGGKEYTGDGKTLPPTTTTSTGGGGGGGTTYYTVTYDANGGSSVTSQSVARGGKVTEPTDPTKTDFVFAGWYKEETLTNLWDFDADTVTGSVTLYAKWLTPHTVTMTDDDNGTASASHTVAGEGMTVTITATSETNFFVKWEVVSGNVTLSSSTENPATFTMPDENVEIKATFQAPGSAISNPTVLKAIALKGCPVSGTVIDISGDPSVIGVLNLIELKANFPNLDTVNVRDTNITDIITGSGISEVLNGGTFSNGERTLSPTSSSLNYSLAASGSGIDLDALIAALTVSGTSDGTAAADVLNGLASWTINDGSATPLLSGTGGGTISHSELSLLGVGSYTLRLELKFKNTSWTYAVNYSLTITDVSYTLTPASVNIYPGATQEFMLKKFDGNQISVGDRVDYTITVTDSMLNPLAVPSTVTSQMGGNVLVITVSFDLSAQPGEYTLTVAESLSNKTVIANITVQALPSIGSLELRESNGGTATVFDPASCTMHIKGGTSISSANAANLDSYTDSTYYLLYDGTTGQPLGDEYCPAFAVTDLDGNVTGEFISVDGYAALRVSGVAAFGGEITGTFTISSIPTILLSTVDVGYTIHPATP